MTRSSPTAGRSSNSSSGAAPPRSATPAGGSVAGAPPPAGCPAGARRFGRGRDGFVTGDGGAVFVREPASAARGRGARAYAAVGGFGASSDAHHPVIPSPAPGPAVAAMRQALAEARVAAEAISY